jgi:hypothetical protein
MPNNAATTARRVIRLEPHPAQHLLARQLVASNLKERCRTHVVVAERHRLLAVLPSASFASGEGNVASTASSGQERRLQLGAGQPGHIEREAP